MESARPPRWRGRLLTAGAVLLAVGGLAFVVARYSEPSSSSEPAPAFRDTTQVVDQKAFDNEAREVAGDFILTAVARRNTGASWALLDPTFPGREGYTKATWAQGDIPVIPFPGAERAQARFRVTFASKNQLTVEVALVPRKGEPAIFDLGLRRRGKGANQRWLVDYWMTRYVAGRPDLPDR